MIDKLNFAKTDVGAIGDRGLSSFADTLLKQGNVFNAQAAQEQEQALNTVKTMSDIASRDRAEQREVDRINKENSTQEALVNYNNAVNRASTLGTMSDEQGKALGSEYGSLVSKVGEEKAAQIVSDKAAGYAATDSANLKASPKLAYDRISPIELPSGSSIDPLKLIAMKEQKLSALEDRQNKLDDRAFKEKEFEANKKYQADSLALQKQEAANRMAERNEDKKEKKDLVNATIASNKVDTGGGELIYDPVTGAYVKNVNTGVKNLDYSTKVDPSTGEVVTGDNTNIMVKKLYDKVGNKIEKAQALAPEIIPEDKLKDDKFLLEGYESVKGSQKNILSGSGITSSDIENNLKATAGVDKKISDLRDKVAFFRFPSEFEKNKAKQEIEDLKKERKVIETSLKKDTISNNMTFDDYKKNIQMSNENKKLEMYNLQKDIDSAYKGIEKDLTAERGVEQKTNKFADVAEVKTKAFNDKFKQIKDSDPTITDSAAVNVALDYSNKVGDNQATIRSTAKTEGETKEEKKSAAIEKDIENRSKIIAKELDTLNDLQKSLITGKEYDDEVADPFSTDGRKISVDDLAALINAKKVNAENKAEELSRYRYETLGTK